MDDFDNKIKQYSSSTLSLISECEDIDGLYYEVRQIVMESETEEEVVTRLNELLESVYEQDDFDARRRHAEEKGWDEAEMNLEEFEDYFGK